jgi:hypothetical protein
MKIYTILIIVVIIYQLSYGENSVDNINSHSSKIINSNTTFKECLLQNYIEPETKNNDIITSNYIQYINSILTNYHSIEDIHLVNNAINSLLSFDQETTETIPNLLDIFINEEFYDIPIMNDQNHLILWKPGLSRSASVVLINMSNHGKSAFMKLMNSGDEDLRFKSASTIIELYAPGGFYYFHTKILEKRNVNDDDLEKGKKSLLNLMDSENEEIQQKSAFFLLKIDHQYYVERYNDKNFEKFLSNDEINKTTNTLQIIYENSNDDEMIDKVIRALDIYNHTKDYL